MTLPPGSSQALGTLLVVALVASGLALYNAQSLNAYPVDYAVHGQQALDAEGTLHEGEKEAHAVTIDGTNLSALTATLEWTDEVGDPDRFEMTVTAPNGTRWDVAGAAAPLVVSIPLHDVPAAHQVYATDRTMAEHLVPPWPPAEDVAGEWTVAVRLAAAPGAAGRVGEPIDGTPDGEQTYTVTVTRTVWSASVGP